MYFMVADLDLLKEHALRTILWHTFGVSGLAYSDGSMTERGC
jgi:hypothetical protein